jgi:hypothetical protein
VTVNYSVRSGRCERIIKAKSKTEKFIWKEKSVCNFGRWKNERGKIVVIYEIMKALKQRMKNVTQTQ